MHNNTMIYYPFPFYFDGIHFALSCIHEIIDEQTREWRR